MLYCQASLDLKDGSSSGICCKVTFCLDPRAADYGVQKMLRHFQRQVQEEEAWLLLQRYTTLPAQACSVAGFAG
jgi:hypothetical protein